MIDEKPLTYDDPQPVLLDRLAVEHATDVTPAGNASRLSRPSRVTPIADFKTPELIMELLSRGFAGIKTPESGIPDTLSIK